MANLYGVANAPGPSVLNSTIGGGNITCPPGVETNIIASNPLIAVSQGFFFAQVLGQVAINIGATPPTALTVGFRIGAGADFWAWSWPSQYLVANAELISPLVAFTVTSQTIWQGTGSIVNVSLNPTAQQVIAFTTISYAYFNLVRAPDQ